MSDNLDEGLFNDQPTFRYRILPDVIWGCLFLVGFLFKIQHWPGHSLLRIIAASGLIGYNISAYIFLKGANKVNNLFLIISLIWILYILYGLLFDPENSFNIMGMGIHLALIGIFYLYYDMIGKKKKVIS